MNEENLDKVRVRKGKAVAMNSQYTLLFWRDGSGISFRYQIRKKARGRFGKRRVGVVR